MLFGLGIHSCLYLMAIHEVLHKSKKIRHTKQIETNHCYEEDEKQNVIMQWNETSLLQAAEQIHYLALACNKVLGSHWK